MKSLSPGLLFFTLSASWLLVSQPVSAATQATTDPVGFTTLTVKGTGGIKPSEVTYLGLGLVSPVEYQATADVVSGTKITCNSATWTDNQFASTPQPGYFLEIFSGAKAGLMSAVVSCSSLNKTITVADDLTALGVEAGGVTFKLRKNWSLNTLFGTANSAGFISGTPTTADLILIYDPNLPDGPGYDQYYYASGGRFGTGWRLLGTADATQDEGNAPISLEEGVIIKRLGSTDLTITIPGAVKLGPTITTVFTGPNFIGNVYPSGVLTLGQTDATATPPKYSSNLYTQDSTSGVLAGSATTADLILIYNPTLDSGAGGFDQYYYSDGGRVGTGWRLVGSDPATTDASGTVLPSGRAILLKRVASTPFNWVIPQPFPNP